MREDVVVGGCCFRAVEKGTVREEVLKRMFLEGRRNFDFPRKNRCFRSMECRALHL